MAKSNQPVDILTELRVHIARKYVTQSEAARVWGYSRVFVSRVLKGEKNPTEKMLADAGFKRIVEATHYVKA